MNVRIYLKRSTRTSQSEAAKPKLFKGEGDVLTVYLKELGLTFTYLQHMGRPQNVAAEVLNPHA